MSWLSKLTNALRPAKLDKDLLEEISDHIERKTNALTQQGLDTADARTAALRAFGNSTRVREQSRDARMFGVLESAVRDVRYAFRGMLNNPSFSATAVLSLALAIGSTTAIYSVIDAAILRPLPVSEPQTLFTLAVPDVDQPGSADAVERQSFSYPLFQDFKAAAGKSARLALFSPINRVEAQGPDPASHLEKVFEQYVSGEAFEMLGVSPKLGRVFSKDDDRGPGQQAEAVLSFDYWWRRFNQDPSIIGRTILIENRTYEVIGIAREGFFGVEPGKFVDVWLPVLMFDPSVFVNPAINWSRVMGRLDPNISPRQLQARLQPVFHDSQEKAIARNPPSSKEMQRELHEMVLRVKSGAEGFSSFRQAFSGSLWITFGVTAGILLIACSNVASLMLARATARSSELAMRVSLGASRSRLVRQMLTESLLLSVFASCLGFAGARVAAARLVQLISRDDDPLRFVLPLDAHLFFFSAAVCTLCALMFGFLPAWRAAAARPLRALRHQDGQAGKLRMGQLFVSIQVAFAFCLVVVGAGFLFTLHNLVTMNTGFDAKDVAVISLSSDLAGSRAAFTPEQMQQLQHRIAASPTVSGVAFAWWAIFEGSHRLDRVTVPGNAQSEHQEIFYRVSPGYFGTLKIPLLDGRDLNLHDSDGQSLVPAVVNKAFAQRYFRGEVVVGQRFVRDDGVSQQIVGVVANSYYGDLHHGPEPVVYFPMKPSAHFTLYLRSSLPAGSALRLVEGEIKAMGRANHVSEMTTLNALVGNTLIKEKMLAGIGGVFAFLGLQIAAIGLFGLLNYAVGRRAKEFGVRAALGARRVQIVRLVMKDLFAMAVAGLAAGAGVSLVIMSLLRSALFGIGMADPAVFATASIIFVIAMFVAGSLPAIRAMNVDPTLALRHD